MKNDQLPSMIDEMGVRVAWTVMLVYAFSVLMPYVLALFLKGAIPPDLLDIIKSNKSTVDLITTAVVMFYFGASVQRKKDQDTLATVVKTNAAQVEAMASTIPSTDSTVVPVAAGESVTVKADEERA